jgi:nucleoside-diphosphate-sugar epimerase
MSRRCLVIGGTGAIGQHVVERLVEDGWTVTVVSRGVRDVPRNFESAGVRVEYADRHDVSALKRAVGSQTELVVDVILESACAATQLLSLQHRIGYLIAISSAGVYQTWNQRISHRVGRDFDLSPPEARPPTDSRESDQIISPGSRSRAERKAAVERVLLGKARIPVTIIRPAALHGPGIRHAREWYFLKRALDRRPFFIYSYSGAAVFHPSSVCNVAELVRCAAKQAGTRIVNCGDPDPPTEGSIGRLIARSVDYFPIDIRLPGPPPSPAVADSPWAVGCQLTLNMETAEQDLCFRPATTYSAAVVETCDWLQHVTAGKPWRKALTLDQYGHLFDYAAEDEFMTTLLRSRIDHRL